MSLGTVEKSDSVTVAEKFVNFFDFKIGFAGPAQIEKVIFLSLDQNRTGRSGDEQMTYGYKLNRIWLSDYSKPCKSAAT